jgi:hypothetical protein
VGWETPVWDPFVKLIDFEGSVPSPPCGMETFSPFLSPFRFRSKPTVWDGDSQLPLLKKCSKPTVWDGDKACIIFFRVPSPPCGMETS